MKITREQALAIAEADASQNYRDLSTYDVSAAFDGEDWQVDYALRDANQQGGGPHYIISGSTGEILSSCYEQ